MENEIAPSTYTATLDELRSHVHDARLRVQRFSRRNLLYMRSFAEAWPSESDLVQQPIAQLPWGHVIELLDKLDDQDLREWYAAKDVHHGWSRAVLAHHITTRLHEREGAAPTNFEAALDRADSDQAQEITKDPYAQVRNHGGGAARAPRRRHDHPCLRR